MYFIGEIVVNKNQIGQIGHQCHPKTGRVKISLSSVLISLSKLSTTHHHSQSLREKEQNGGEGKDADDDGEEDELEQEEPIFG